MEWTWPQGATEDARRTLRVFSITPNWKEGIVERLEWLTDVMTSESDNEQRRSNRLHPRRTFETSFMRADTQRQRLDSFLVGVGAAVFLVPLWHEQFKLGEARSDGTVMMPSTAMREFNVGDLVMLSAGDPHDYSVLKVEGRTSNTILLKSYTDVGSWPVGARITPLRRARIMDPISMTGPVQNAVEVPLKFTLIDADDTVGAAWAYANNLWSFKADRSEALKLDYTRNVYTVDFNAGVFDVFDLSGQEQISTTLRVGLYGRAKINKFRHFLYAARGKAVSFWAPSFMQDITPIENLTGLNLIAAPSGFDDAISGPQLSRRYIAIQTNDYTYYRELNNVSTIREGRKPVATVYTVTKPLPELDRDAVASISFLSMVRFDNDGFDLLHRTDNATHISTSVLLKTVKQNDPLDLPLDSYLMELLRRIRQFALCDTYLELPLGFQLIPFLDQLEEFALFDTYIN